jgi:hypothetical protein
MESAGVNFDNWQGKAMLFRASALAPHDRAFVRPIQIKDLRQSA